MAEVFGELPKAAVCYIIITRVRGKAFFLLTASVRLFEASMILRANNMLLFLSVIENDDDRAFVEKLYYDYGERMYGVAYSALRSASDAEDAVQTVFMNIAAKHLQTVKELDEGRKKNYLLAAAKYAALSILRGKKKTVSLDSMAEDGYEPSSDEDFTEWVCANCEKDDIIKAMGRLDPLYGIVLYYHFGEDMPAQQIAELLGKKLSTVKAQLVRGKKLLMKELRAGGEAHA